jgi:predicted ATPase
MSALFETSVVCPNLIGRAPQLAALERLIAQAAGGHGRTATLVGEAGMGKSRLVGEAQARAAGQGFAILVGRCFEPDRALPYAPLIDMLRAHLGARPPQSIVEDIGPIAPQLISLLPEFARLVPGAAPALDPEHERRRIAQSFAQFVVDQSI